MGNLRLGIMALLCLAASACSSGDEALPTLVPVEPSPPTAEVVEIEASPAGVEPTATPTQVRVRPTLPPTFTPTPSPTLEPAPTRVFPTATPFISAATPDPNCVLFTVNFEQSTTQFNVGESPRAVWNPIPGAELYRVILRTENEQVVTDQIYVAETSYQFPPGLFNPGVVYGWEVYPINARNDQMCFTIGSIFIPVTPAPIIGS